jgi:hypothetical protein
VHAYASFTLLNSNVKFIIDNSIINSSFAALKNYYQMNKLYFSIIAFLFLSPVFNPLYAQNIGESIDASVGLGLSSPYDETDVSGEGFYAQAEYVYSPHTWFSLRPYVGMVFASGESDEKTMPGYRIKSNAALLGGKIRLTAPIPYFAPFFEVGVGTSIGSFVTHTPETDLKKSGVLLHIPVTVGVALGRRHNVEIKFVYYEHEAVKQSCGAAALGISFPLDDN